MRALTVLPLLGTSVSVACAFAAVGVALYAPSQVWSAGGLYGAFGLAAGVVCGVIDLAWRGLPSAGVGAGAVAVADDGADAGADAPGLEEGTSGWSDSVAPLPVPWQPRPERAAPSVRPTMTGGAARAAQPSRFGA